MAYKTNDGMVLRSIKPEDVVAELRQTSHTPTVHDEEFMQITADRVSSQLGLAVPTYNARAFVERLVKIGLLVREN